MMRYTFLGDRATRKELRGMQCDLIRNEEGRCIISTKFATAAVLDAEGRFFIVPRRRLRLNYPKKSTQNS